MGERIDVVIVGGGPAALSAAIYASRGGLKAVILERTALGGQVALTDSIDNYPGFPEGISGPQLVERMEAQARRFGTEIRIEEVKSIAVDGHFKVITTSKGEYRAPVVVLAMGADPRLLDVPGEQELRGRGVSYCGTCDGPLFRNKKVAVIGGGDSALKEALFISKFAAELVLVHRRQGFRAEKIYQDEVHKEPKISLELDAVVERIVGEKLVEGVEVRNVKTEESKIIDCQGVFIFVGHIPNTHFLCNLFENKCGDLIPTDRDAMTAISGIYAVGDVREGSRRQVATAVGEGATAALAAEHLIGELKARGEL